MASSSSSAQGRSIVSPKLYDVFISHRGPDVKQTLVKQFYDLPQERGCKAFLDREVIEGGDSITSAIHNAICSSRVPIAIFSKGYAQSSWSLDELVLMLQQTHALFIPVFYHVQPSELHHIENNKSQYAAAFADYESKRRHLDKLDNWKKALASAADISGYELSQHHPDDLCEKIASRVVQVMEKSIPLHVAKYPVGLDELVQDFEMSCCSKTAGLGGSGKTTLAKELFNKKRSGYNASCFLSDVRESHARGELNSLQRQLLKDLFSRDEEIKSVHHGIGLLKDHLGRSKYLRSGSDYFQMHDHLRDLGRQMADELGPPRLWQPELLRSMEAKGFKQILAETKGRCFHSFLDSSLRRDITYFITETDLLWLDFGRSKYKLYFPSWIPLRKLHFLHSYCVKDLWSSFQQQLHINSQVFPYLHLSMTGQFRVEKAADSRLSLFAKASRFNKNVESFGRIRDVGIPREDRYKILCAIAKTTWKS